MKSKERNGEAIQLTCRDFRLNCATFLTSAGSPVCEVVSRKFACVALSNYPVPYALVALERIELRFVLYQRAATMVRRRIALLANLGRLSLLSRVYLHFIGYRE